MINSKDFKKILNELKKESKSSLSSACKLFARNYGNNKANVEALADKDCSKETIKEFTRICADKEAVLAICKAIAPRIDDTFVRFVNYETTNKVTGEKKVISDKQKEMIMTGNVFKPFGFATELEPLDGCIKTQVAESDTKKVIKVAIPITNYTLDLVAKCLQRFLALPEESKEKILAGE